MFVWCSDVFVWLQWCVCLDPVMCLSDAVLCLSDAVLCLSDAVLCLSDAVMCLSGCSDVFV